MRMTGKGNKQPWILFLSLRYFRTRRKARGLAPSILSVAGITVGVVVLISVIGVMNGFQLGFIEDILEISSYHVRIAGGQTVIAQEKIDEIRGFSEVKSIIPLMDVQVLSTGAYNDIEAVLLRGIDKDAELKDPGLIDQLNIQEGEFNLGEEKTIVMGVELARALGLDIGDQVTFLSLGGASFESLETAEHKFTVTGLFKSGYYEFDRNMGFINLSAAELLQGNDDGKYWGIKLYNRFKDRETYQKITGLLNDPYAVVTSWREYNKSFFSALRMEKLVMMILLSLIFIVVGVNIFHSLKRTVYERMEEIGVLRSVGADGRAIQWIFVFEGILIGFAGAVLGTILGLLIAGNINALFMIVENITNLLLRIASSILLPLSGGEDFAIFSPRYYYLSEVPSRVLFPEVVSVFVFAVLISSLSAFLASRRAAAIKPAEVLRDE